MNSLSKTKPLLIFFTIIAFMGNITLSQDTYYITKAPITHLHNQPHQLIISTGYGGGFFGDASFSISKQLSLFASGFRQKEKREITTLFGDRRKDNIDDSVLQFGVAYSKPIKSLEFIFLQPSIGYSMTSTYRKWYFIGGEDSKNVETADYSSIFAQFSFFIILEKHTFIITSRFTRSYYDNATEYDTDYPSDKRIREDFKINSIATVLGYNYSMSNTLALQLQLGYSRGVDKRGADQKYYSYTIFNSLIYKIGLVYYLNSNRE